MSKRNLILTLIAVVLSILLCAVYFFMPESPLAVKYYPPSCDPSKTDCSKFTPDGTPFVRPPEPVQATTTQAGQIDEHLFIDNTLKDVNFCGKIYQAKQIFIDGVDVVQRIAELATKEPRYGEYICRTAYELKSSGWLVSNEIGIVTAVNKTDLGTKVYRIDLIASFSSPTHSLESASHISDFEVNPETGMINIILSGYAEISKKTFGTLK